MIGWLADWLVDWLGWLVGLLVACLVDWFASLLNSVAGRRFYSDSSGFICYLLMVLPGPTIPFSPFTAQHPALPCVYPRSVKAVDTLTKDATHVLDLLGTQYHWRTSNDDDSQCHFLLPSAPLPSGFRGVDDMRSRYDNMVRKATRTVTLVYRYTDVWSSCNWSVA